MKSAIDSRILLEFVHNGYDCVVAHNGVGYLCGYVRVQRGHPWYGMDYDDVAASVHGGLSYAYPDDDGYWIGFDCDHSNDVFNREYVDNQRLLRALELNSTLFEGMTGGRQPNITVDYVRRQCIRLANQAHTAFVHRPGIRITANSARLDEAYDYFMMRVAQASSSVMDMSSVLPHIMVPNHAETIFADDAEESCVDQQPDHAVKFKKKRKISFD